MILSDYYFANIKMKAPSRGFRMEELVRKPEYLLNVLWLSRNLDLNSSHGNRE